MPSRCQHADAVRPPAVRQLSRSSHRHEPAHRRSRRALQYRHVLRPAPCSGRARSETPGPTRSSSPRPPAPGSAASSGTIEPADTRAAPPGSTPAPPPGPQNPSQDQAPGPGTSILPPNGLHDLLPLPPVRGMAVPCRRDRLAVTAIPPPASSPATRTIASRAGTGHERPPHPPAPGVGRSSFRLWILLL